MWTFFAECPDRNGPYECEATVLVFNVWAGADERELEAGNRE
jgi:hypothetical protein